MIVPTVGRVVWVRMTREQIDYLRKCGNAAGEIAYLPGGAQPMVGHVVYVHDDRLVSLRVFDHNGEAFILTSVRLLQDNEAPSGVGIWAEWMPYQKGQAAKTEELETKLAG